MAADREQIIAEEAKFADEHYQPYAEDLDINPTMFRKYSHPSQMWDWRQRAALLMGDLAGKKVLDLGCGMGEETVYFAKLGAEVWSIDVSPVGVEITRRRAEHNGLADRVHAQVMAADPTAFQDASFDLVHGLGILHHIGLAPGLAEVKRLLKPGGLAVFLEPMGNSRLVDRLKALVYGGEMDYTDHEKPLEKRELLAMGRQFAEFRLFPYHLTFRLRSKLPWALAQKLPRLDYHLLKFLPPLTHFAGGVVVYLRK